MSALTSRFTELIIVVTLAMSLPTFVLAQPGDFNADGLYDCSDLDLLQARIMEGSTDAIFDLNGSGGPIDLDDVSAWFDKAGEVSGFHYLDLGDFNLDGGVDERDGNIMGINWQQQDRTYCRGDADFDGVVNSADKGVLDINFLQGTTFARPGSDVTLSPIGDSLTVWTNGQPAVIAETDQFQLTARPVLSPDGLLVTVVGLRTSDPNDRVVSVTDVAFDGELHQAGLPTLIPGFVLPTTTVDSFSPERDGDLSRTDSHMLLGVWNEDVAMPIIFGLQGMGEDNDSSNPNDLDASTLGATVAAFGIGPLKMPADYGGFVLGREKQSHFVELAQLTTPARMPGTDRPGGVSMSVGTLGADADDRPMEEWARFGIDTPISVPFLFAPCDFDHDGFCGIEDVNQLVRAVGTDDQQIDLVPPVDLIDTRDIDAWLSWASEMSPERTFGPGDANLDGSVDGVDLNVIGLSWQERLDVAAWDSGDFNGDQIVDARDLNVLARNWRFETLDALVNVPEPATSSILVVMATICLCLRKR